MKLYFKRDAESEFGEGVVYFEITDNWPTRQVEKYGERWFYSDVDSPTYNELGLGLADQPLEVMEMKEEHKITKEEFENIWKQATTERKV